MVPHVCKVLSDASLGLISHFLVFLYMTKGKEKEVIKGQDLGHFYFMLVSQEILTDIVF